MTPRQLYRSNEFDVQVSFSFTFPTRTLPGPVMAESTENLTPPSLFEFHRMIVLPVLGSVQAPRPPLWQGGVMLMLFVAIIMGH